LGIDKKLPFRLYARYTMKDHPNRYFACSQKAGEWLFGRNRLATHPLTVLNNAVNVDEFTYDESARTAVRDEIGAGSRLVLGHIGRFNKQKNHSFLLDIFHEVHKKHPDSMLVMAGDGNLRPALEKKVDQLGLSSAVKFLGIRGDIARLMQGMDLFLFPSLFEGLPVVLIEAQAAGLTCVVSDAITREADVTGRITFLPLRQSPGVWADQILASSVEHLHTAELLRQNGYDTHSMAHWLRDYYARHSLQAEAL
jgi:glycosyltransferase involved in cell wall biosynthesis